MEAIIFLVVWLGGASLHTIVELRMRKDAVVPAGFAGKPKRRNV